MKKNLIRCFGNKLGQKLYANYHDTEWCKPVYDETKIFECLTLECFQSGLSFEIILKKRENFRKAFYNFDLKKVANMSNDELDGLLLNPMIIRNKLKIYSTKINANVFLRIQEDYTSFTNYIWGFVNFKPIINNWACISDMPNSNDLSILLSKELKLKGMKFIGPVIIYSFLQSIGLINDHISTCSFKN